ncbi:MAG: hypothetical protein Q9221_006303 [Calogaya cf. arnoldii]
MTSDFSAPGLLGWLTREAGDEDEDEPWDQGLSSSLHSHIVFSQNVQSLLVIQSLRERMYTLAVMRTDAKLRDSYIVEEFVTGGDLMSLIERHDWRVDPDECCLIVYQILKAVSYLHQSGITHRDIKPENILMSSTFPGARVILTDFGGAIKINIDSKRVSNRMLTMTGTRDYVAPEVRGNNRLVEQSGYTRAVDMWSVGCVTAATLVGRPAFATSQMSGARQDSAAAVIAAATKYDLHVLDDSDVWGDIDIQPKDFIRRLLVLDEQARLTADQALLHDWFKQGGDRHDVLTRYKKAIAGWKPTWPGWDFKEDLNAFIDRRIPSYDVSSPGWMPGG